MTTRLPCRLLCLWALVSLMVAGCGSSPASSTDAKQALPAVELLNVSYDPTREFYQEYNQHFAKEWQAQHQQPVTIQQSHGGSGKQARAVIDGLGADVVTLALGHDIDVIAKKSQLIDEAWRSRLPHNSAPYTSTIVFLVRKGNPKNIRDWADLEQPDLKFVAANPKTGGGARWNYLAAWGAILHRELKGDWQKLHDPQASAEVAAAQAKAREFVGSVYRRMEVLDSGARGATNSFVQRGIGDVLLAWENEAFLTVKELGPDQVDIVVPSVSILAEPAVALVDMNVDKHQTREIATAYLEGLFSPPGQALAARYYFRPAKPESVAPADLEKFQKVQLFTMDEAFGGWSKVQPEHFDDGGIFDQFFAEKK